MYMNLCASKNSIDALARSSTERVQAAHNMVRRSFRKEDQIIYKKQMDGKRTYVHRKIPNYV